MAFDRNAVKQRTAELAAKGVFIGTSSWKYDGWFGQLWPLSSPTASDYYEITDSFAEREP